MEINGLRFGAQRFSGETRNLLLPILQMTRLTMPLPPEALKGPRFKSDDHVLWLLESGATEDEVKANLLEAARLGLEKAAKSDWWYTYEKDWGNEYEGEDCEVEGDGVEG
jgi:hypothetical protein